MSKHGHYREGQVIPHDALLDYTCTNDEGVEEEPRHLQCKLGRVIPNLPSCNVEEGNIDIQLLATGSGFDGSQASIPYAASPFLVKDGDFQKKIEANKEHTM